MPVDKAICFLCVALKILFAISVGRYHFLIPVYCMTNLERYSVFHGI